MTLNATMSSALSGLTVTSRKAELVATNIANATTDGYARRELQVGARSVGSSGQGVTATGITRMTDPLLTGDRRLAQAGAADREVSAGFLYRMETALGSPEEEGSLTARIAEFDASLIAAASRPDAETRLAAVAEAGRALAGALNEATDGIQAARAEADRTIATEVGQINTALSGVAGLNAQILRLITADRDASALIDQRQQLIDGIAAMVPLREIDRGQGQIALYAAGGAVLLDGTRPATLGFTPTPVITAGMTLQDGPLSGLTVNGRAVQTGAGSPLAGGSLIARFGLRDDLATGIQARLDGLARDLADRFGPGGPDATLAAGAPGLFTDAGGAVTAAAERGLAGRLTLSAAVDPDQGGALWRLRDGLGAAAPGASGDATLLIALDAALTGPRVPASAALPDGARSHAVLAAEVVSGLASDRLSAEAGQSYTATRAEALRVLELEGGVDTDRELQDLLVIETSYAANARVLKTVDQMIQLLLGL